MSIAITITDPHLIPRAKMIDLTDYLLLASQGEDSPRIMSGVSESSIPKGVIVHPSVPGLSVVVPSAPPAPAAPAAIAELDKNGLPWDVRIHADTKSKNQDGTWRYRRGVKDEVIRPVEEELRRIMGAVPQETEPVEMSASGEMSVPVAPTAVPVPPAPPVPSAPEAPDTATDDFHGLAHIVTKAIAAKTLTQAQVADVLKQIGAEHGCELPHLGALLTRTDLVAVARTKIQALVAAGGATV